MEQYFFPSRLFPMFVSHFLHPYFSHKPKLTLCLDRGQLNVAMQQRTSSESLVLTTTIFPSTSLLFIVVSLPFHF